ncbi:hypothetical protein ARC78_14395 [Stenotrophomonas pictorum JCM 9942]|uniref:HTH luxR-type domain-containing protein n=1 Tax=Stenotrophomonas pictorum JCM 9942 TaxID=1236960 RepID=A0A0R0AE15_9GAMM|nr:helix-turn-helix transcriptional regulator [Stenotrophomonas pictorum]KRG39665.1 hypothetical protein ARC78_14395 [Stenotrophomonas pictorum JCM 9942]
MLIVDVRCSSSQPDPLAAGRAALVRALDMCALWQACAALINTALPCHSCSLLSDIDGYQPQEGRHHLNSAADDGTRLVNSLEVAAPYLDANPLIRSYTFSQIASQDVDAPERLRAQNPTPGWRDFIHLAFWDGTRLEAVLSIRLHIAPEDLGGAELGFLAELYPLLEAGLQRIRALESERLHHRAVADLLHQLPLAAVLVNENLLPAFLSREASRLCRRWSADSDRDGHLPRAIEAPLRRWMQDLPATAAPPGNRASLTLEHPVLSGERLHLQLSSAPGNSRGHAQHLLILTAQSAAPELEAPPASSALPVLERLSPSERKVALLVATGLRNDAIADQLCRSRKTIECQISSIFRKLDIDNRTQLARLLN